jgi:hypothetical protein
MARGLFRHRQGPQQPRRFFPPPEPPPFDPSPFAGLWPETPGPDQQTSRGQTWFAPEAEARYDDPALGNAPPTAFGQGLGQEQPADWRPTTWFQPDAEEAPRGIPPFAITTATVAQEAALWSEQPADWRAPSWFAPDASFEAPFTPAAAFDPAPVVPAIADSDVLPSNWPRWFAPEPEQAALLQARPAATLTDYVRAVLADNPASYFRLNEPLGYSNETRDAWGTSYDRISPTRLGTWQDGTGIYDANKPGAIVGETDPAYETALGDAVMVIPAASWPSEGTGDFTVEIWVQTTSVSLRTAASRKASAGVGDIGWVIQRTATVAAAKAIVSDGTTQVTLLGVTPVDTGFHHYVLTRQGANFELWLDGVLEASSGAGPAGSLTAPVDLTLGGFGGASATWTGGLDEFAFYSSKLSAEQITNHYTIGRQLYAPSIQGDEIANAARPWPSPDASFEAPFTPAAAFDPAPVAGAYQGDDHPPRATDPRWFTPEPEVLGIPPFAITTATVAEQAALWQEQPADWRPASEFRPDDAFEGLTPPSAFDPAPFAGLFGSEVTDRQLTPLWHPDDPTEPATEILFNVPPRAALYADGSGQQDRSIWPTWADLVSTEAWTPIPNLTVATVDQQAGLWQDSSGQQDRSLQPVWTDHAWVAEGFTPQVAAFDPTSAGGIWPEQPGQERSNAVRWFVEADDTLGLPPFATTVATVAQQAAAWPEQPGQDKSLQPVWFRPDDPFDVFPQPVPPFDPATQFAGLPFEPEIVWRRDFTPDSIEAHFAGPLQSWLFTSASPATIPAIFIDVTTGDPYIHLDGPFIARVD